MNDIAGSAVLTSGEMLQHVQGLVVHSDPLIDPPCRAARRWSELVSKGARQTAKRGNCSRTTVRVRRWSCAASATARPPGPTSLAEHQPRTLQGAPVAARRRPCAPFSGCGQAPGGRPVHGTRAEPTCSAGPPQQREQPQGGTPGDHDEHHHQHEQHRLSWEPRDCRRRPTCRRRASGSAAGTPHWAGLGEVGE